MGPLEWAAACRRGHNLGAPSVNRCPRAVRVAFFCALPALVGIQPARGAEPATTVLLVRHAEKASDGGRDPTLTARGQAWSRALAVALAPAGVRAIYATPFKRTLQTAAPTAAALGLRVHETPVQADFTRDLARQILEAHRGQTVLVVGHSNTLGPTIAALGGGPTFELEESAYGDLFVCTVPAAGPPTLLRLKVPVP